MGESRKVPASVLRVCKDHLEASPEISQILWFPDVEEPEDVRILEIDPSAGPRIDEVVPFRFAATEDYPSVTIAVILPEELDKVRAGEIPLPRGWPALDDGFSVPLDELRQVAA